MRKIYFIASLLAGVASSLFAQEGREEHSLVNKEIHLEEVTVTSSRIAMPIAQTPKLVTIISQKEIEKAQVNSVLDLLTYASNIDIQQRGPHGAQTDISLRGGSVHQVAVLLNGVNISNAQAGYYSFDLPVNISDIERIEVLHGPSALIYGASAFSGGVNIITKKEVTDKAYVNVTAGMHDMRGIEVRGALKTGMASHSLSVSHSSSDGYIHNTDYDIYNALWQTRLHLIHSNKIDFQLGYNDKSYGANSFYTAAYADQYENTSTYLATVKGEFGTKLKVIPILYWSRHTDRFDLIKDTDYGRNYHRGDTYGANLIAQYAWEWGITNLGAEVRKEDIMSSKLGKALAKPHGKYTAYDDRVNTSVTLDHTLTMDNFILSAGVLMNHNSFIHGDYRFYPSASASYRPSETLTLVTSWSKSSRMPTFTELYYNTDTHTANENLLPEKSEAADLGLKFRNSLIRVDVTGFLQWGRNMIDWIKEDVDAKPMSTNITKIDTKGIESNVHLQLSAIWPALGNNALLSLGYTRMWQSYDTHNFISESHEKLNYLRDKFTAQLTHRVYKGLSANWYFRHQKRMGHFSKYVDHVDTGILTTYPGFSTVDLKLDYKYEELSLHLAMNNLLDKSYFDLGNIRQPGFWLMGGISYRFK